MVYAYKLQGSMIGKMDTAQAHSHVPGLSQFAPVHPGLQTQVLWAEQVPPF
jgi:hypothetical protein